MNRPIRPAPSRCLSALLLGAARSCSADDGSVVVGGTRVALPGADAVYASKTTAAFHRHSPDGARVAFLEREAPIEYPADEIEDYALVVAKSDGSGRRVVTGYDRRLWMSFPPAWAPDGETLACTLVDEELGASLGVLRLSETDGNLHVIGSIPSPRSNPAWSPDGERLAVVNLSERRDDDSYRWIVHVIDATGVEEGRCELPYEPATEACTPIHAGREVCGLTWAPGLEVLLLVEDRQGVPGPGAAIQEVVDTIQTLGHPPDRSLHIPWFHEATSGAELELVEEAWFEDHGIIPLERMSASVRQAFSRWSR